MVRALSEVLTKEECTVCWMFGHPRTIDALRGLGISEGVPIRIILKDSGGMVVEADGRRVALDMDAAYMIKV